MTDIVVERPPLQAIRAAFRGLAEALATALVFVSVGPPVGAVVMLAGVGIGAVLQGPDLPSLSDLLGGVVAGGVLLIIAVPIGYVVGFAPAAVTGLAVGLLRACFASRALSYAAAALTGAASPVMLLLVVGETPADQSPEFIACMAAAGLIAALVCTALAGRLGLGRGSGRK